MLEKEKGSQKGYFPKFEQTREWILFSISRDTKFKKKKKKKREECEEFILFAMQLLLKKKRMNYCNFNLRNAININLCTRIRLNATLITDPL